jgi:ParB/RepB/Spo0J family partition protein
MTPHESSSGPNPQANPLSATAGRPTPERNPGLAQAGDGEEMHLLCTECDPDPDQPRRHINEERDNELEQSIREHGQLVSALAYCDPATRRFPMLDGHRRLLILQRLGRKTIRAYVLKEPPDNVRRSEIRLIINEQRLELEEDERGIAYLDHMTLTGITASALATKVGKSVAYVTRSIKQVKEFPDDVRELIRRGLLPRGAARELFTLKTDDAKRHFARLYTEGKITSGKELAAAIKAAKNGHSSSTTSGFTCDEAGVRIAVSWTGAADAQALARVESSLRTVLKDLAGQKHRGLDHFKNFLDKKAKAARKAADLAEAQKTLADVSNPPPERTTTNG